jgi:hypothetical protein
VKNTWLSLSPRDTCVWTFITHWCLCEYKDQSQGVQRGAGFYRMQAIMLWDQSTFQNSQVDGPRCSFG